MTIGITEIQMLIGIQKDQTALIYSLWNVYQGLSFLLIGYVFSQEYVRKNPLLLTCFSLSLLLFSRGNHAAILRAQELVVAATRQLNDAAQSQPDLATVLHAFHAPATESLALAHNQFTLFAVAGVWLPYLAACIAGWRDRSNRLPD